MSKASRQSISLLAVVNGIFITIEAYKLVPELLPTILYGKDVCEQSIQAFPESGNRHKNLKWMQERIAQADETCNSDKLMHSMIKLTCMADKILIDLMEKIKDPVKLSLIEPIHEVLLGISGKIDPNGDCFEAYEEAEVLTNELYKKLEFCPV